MDSPVFTCCICGFKWKAMTEDDARLIVKAIQVNKSGPYCNLCLHLEMAKRFAEARKFNFQKFILQWLPKARSYHHSLKP